MSRERAIVNLIVGGTLIAATAMLFVIIFTQYGRSQAIECEPQRVTGDKHYWSWRIIDGRQCWYQGRPGKPKSELRWAAEPVRRSRPPDMVEQPAGDPDPGSAASMLTEDDLLARTCCWPDLEELQRETGVK